MYRRQFRRRRYATPRRSRSKARFSTKFAPSAITGRTKTYRSRRSGSRRRYTKRRRFSGRGRSFRKRRYGSSRKSRRTYKRRGSSRRGGVKRGYTYRQISARGCIAPAGVGCWFDSPCLGELFRLQNVQNDAITNYIKDSRNTYPSGMPAMGVVNTTLTGDQATNFINDDLSAENFWLKGRESVKYRVVNASNKPTNVTIFKYIPKRSCSAWDPFLLERPCNSNASFPATTQWAGLPQVGAAWAYPATFGVYDPAPATGINDPQYASYTSWTPFLFLRQLGAYRQRYPPRYTARIYSIPAGYSNPGSSEEKLDNAAADNWNNDLAVLAGATVGTVGTGENNPISGFHTGIVSQAANQPQSYVDGKVPAVAPVSNDYKLNDWSIQTGYNEQSNFYLKRFFKVVKLGRVSIPIGGQISFVVRGKPFNMNPVRDKMIDPITIVNSTSGACSTYGGSTWTAQNAQVNPDAGQGGFAYPSNMLTSSSTPFGTSYTCGAAPTMMGPGCFTRTIPVSFFIKGEYGIDTTSGVIGAFKPNLNVMGTSVVVEETYTCQYGVSCNPSSSRGRHRTEVNMLGSTVSALQSFTTVDGPLLQPVVEAST